MPRPPRDDLVELFPPLPYPRRVKTAPSTRRVMPATVPRIAAPRPLAIPEVKVALPRKLRAPKPPARRGR